MAEIKIYTKSWCPYCVSAKELLKSKNVSFIEIDIERQPEQRAEMIERAHGGITVPQIFINDDHIGGCDDLHALERDGKLDARLKA